MEEGKAHPILRDSWFRYENHLKKEDQWLKVDGDQDGSSQENSMVSEGSSVSLTFSDTADDASTSNSSGSLYDLSELMVELPVKRGLSKFYQGKSESFTSLSRVTSVEDLAKKPTSSLRRRLKSWKSCGNGSSSAYKPYILPKSIISKAKKLDTSNKRGSFIRRPAALQEKTRMLIGEFPRNIDTIS